MCGIVGCAGYPDSNMVRSMAGKIIHRGPDGEGFAFSKNSNIAIGMRRLAIIDLETGDQPFTSSDKKVNLVFNGEIYNFKELKKELERLGIIFNSRSDTEVILNSYLYWGNRCWSRLHGMFTVAIIDERNNRSKLILARDRVGIKPLYYRVKNGKLIFASEIKSILDDHNYRPDLNLNSLKTYLSFRYVPGSECLFKEIEKFPSGKYMVWENSKYKLKTWWVPPISNNASKTNSLNEASQSVGKSLEAAVKRHMISDVPVGAFLSGGIDSNILVALMSKFSKNKIKTFSIGFPEFKSNELNLASLTAKTFNTDHHSIECKPSDMSMLSDVVYSLDEPIGDAIVVAMSVLAKEASKELKVVLSGEGADEIFGGYMFHKKILQMQKIKKIFPKISFDLAEKIIRLTPHNILNKFFDYPGNLGEDGKEKVIKIIRNINSQDIRELYNSTISLIDQDEINQLLNKNVLFESLPSKRDFEINLVENISDLENIIRLQYESWLPDDILMKADKINMAHSLEGRVPFLDELVINAANLTKDNQKIGFMKNKLALREFSNKILPNEIVNAPKQAFYVPLESYIKKNPLKNIFDRALDSHNIKTRGLFNESWILNERKKSEKSGFLPNKKLFSIVMLELWFERFMPDISWK